MVSIFKGVRGGMVFVSALVTFVVGCFLKISPIIGSQSSFFSLSDALCPLVGVGGLGVGLLVACARSSMSMYILQAPLRALLYHIPGFLASASWAYPGYFLRIVLPLVCIVAFTVHPIGMHVIPYTFYWLIPIAIQLSKKKSIFLQALAATFVAHAVGSVIWLYAKEIPVAVWWSLIPVVAGERLLNACMMTSAYYLVREVVGCARFVKRSGWYTRQTF